MENSNLQRTLEKLLAAKCPEDVFGADASEKKISVIYRRLAKVVHPDKGGSTEAFAALKNHYDKAVKRLAAGLYGTVKPTPVPPPAEVLLKGESGKLYTLRKQLYTGDICNIFEGGYDDSPKGKPNEVLIKVPRHPKDNDLMLNEKRILLYLNKENETRKVFGNYRPSIPEYVDSISISDAPGVVRKSNVMYQGMMYTTLEELRKIYPNGLPLEHVVWVMNRMLEIQGFLYEVGVVHGAITPNNFLIQHETHGGYLVDWCYAGKKEDGQDIPAVAKPDVPSLFIPKEITKDKRLFPQTDIFMIGWCIRALMGHTAPTKADLRKKYQRMWRFTESMILPEVSMRPDNGLALQKSWKAMAFELFGEPTYIPLPI